MIKWDGGKTPEGITEDTLVTVIYRDGKVVGPSKGWSSPVVWEHFDCSPELDIVGYEITRIN